MKSDLHQKVHSVDTINNIVYLMTRAGNIYSVHLNRLFKSIEVGDTAVVDITGDKWLIKDIIKKYPKHLNITEFPRTETGDLNTIAYSQYLQFIEEMKEEDRVEFDNYLIEKYNIRRIHQ